MNRNQQPRTRRRWVHMSKMQGKSKVTACRMVSINRASETGIILIKGLGDT